MTMRGPNYTVVPNDWANLEYIISDLCSRIIDEDSSFSDYILKDGTRAYTGTGAGFKNDMVDDLEDATVSQNAIRDFVLEQVPDGTVDNQVLQWDHGTTLWVPTLTPAGLTSIGVTGTGTFGEIIDLGLTASLGVYTDINQQLTSTAPITGILGYWTRDSGTGVVSLATVTDDLNIDSGTLVVDAGDSTVNGVMMGAYASTSTKFGFEAAENATGTQSAYFGYQAGYGATAVTDNTGQENVGIGRVALYHNTTGWGNMAVGNESLYTNTTGLWNSGIGSESLYLNVDGNRNTGVGQRSLRGNVGGDDNTGIGQNALYYNADGSENVAIGRLAANGYTGDLDLTTVNQGVFIGASTEAKANSSVNEIVIGYDATGNGDNTTTIGNSSNTGTFLPSDLTVGVNSLVVDVDAAGANPMVSTAGNLNVTGTINLLEMRLVEDDRNIRIGTSTTFANITTGAVDNVALGPSAGRDLTVGERNMYIGKSAGQSNLESDNNVYIGANAGAFALSEDNLGIGSSALGRLIGVIGFGNGSNVAIGQSALRGASSGTITFKKNVAVGTQCGTGMVDGTENVILGYIAGQVLTTGDKNVIIGSQSGASSLVSGIQNTFLGNGTGKNNNGSNNVFIGAFAGRRHNLAGDTSILLIDSLLRDDTRTTMDANALIKGKFSTTVANQTLSIRAATDISYDLTVGGNTATGGGRIKNTTRYTATQAIPVTDDQVYCNGTFTVTLPTGVDGQTFRIINSGTGTITITSAENIVGSTEDVILNAGDIIILTFETTDKWW